MEDDLTNHPYALPDNPRMTSQGEFEIGPNGTSLTLLQLVYRNPSMPLHTRLRAAISALPMEHPRLGFTYQVSSEGDFASLLDARIARMKRQEAKLIEQRPQLRIADRLRRRI
jgi:hypothetical protein